MPSTTQPSGVAQRVYVFALDTQADQGIPGFTWTIQFHYPDDDKQLLLLQQRRHDIAASALVGNTGSEAGVDPAQWNFHYTFAGDKSQVPVKIFDNGTFTYFEFAASTDTPAIFLVDQEQNESLVNGVRQGRYVVVHRTARQFTLRNGHVVTCIFNENFSAEPTLDQASPIKRAAHRKRPEAKAPVAPQQAAVPTAAMPQAER